MKIDLSQHLAYIGKKVQIGWEDKATRYGVPIEGLVAYIPRHFSFKHPEPLVLKTLFTQSMLEKGFLATTAFYASFAHKDKDVNDYLELSAIVFVLPPKP